MEMNLSEHVTRSEFERSDTAIKLGINNAMNEAQLKSAKALCENVFEPIREHVGKPIRINSGFRSAALNKRIGGASSSQHCRGEAMDLDLTSRELFVWILKNVEFDQLIAEFPQGGKASWFHISYKKEKNRGQVLVATKQKGKTVYLPYSQAEHLLY